MKLSAKFKKGWFRLLSCQAYLFFFLQSWNKRCILLIGVYSRAAFVGTFPSICGVSSRGAFNLLNNLFI